MDKRLENKLPDLDQAQNLLDKADLLVAEGQKLIAQHPPHIKVTKTDTIKAHFARMGVSDLSLVYIIRVLEPVELIAEIYRIPVKLGEQLNEFLTLKTHLLEQWRSNFKNGEDVVLKAAGAGWMLEVDKVELIECDLLVPRK
jgi:hypothetical protein